MVDTDKHDPQPTISALANTIARMDEANRLHNATLGILMDAVEALERRVAKLEKATPGEWVRPGTRANYVDVTEGADDIPVGADG